MKKRAVMLSAVVLLLCSACAGLLSACLPEETHTHTLEYVPAQAPTQDAAGHAQYWKCGGCDALFSDEKGERQVEYSQLILPPAGEHEHSFSKVNAVKPTCGNSGNAEYWMCADCGKCFADSEGKEEISLEDTIIAPTGDHNYVDGVCTVCHSVEPGTGVQEVEYELLQGGTYAVTGIGSVQGSRIVIPAQHNGAAVTEIGQDAFSDCDGITEISLPESVTVIGERAFFNCAALTDLFIPESVTSIGSEAFSGCRSLTSIAIPRGVENIESYLFNGCSSLESVTIGSRVASIGSRAFFDCASLTDITIPEDVTVIEWEAFAGCTSLESITIPASVTELNPSAFRGCASLAEITVEEGNGVYHSEGNCVIHTGGKTLLIGCKSSVIPDDGSVTNIGKGAFGDCTSLESIVIPASITEIIGDAFFGCTSLESVTVAEGNGVYHSAGNCVIETEDKTLIVGCKNSVIPADGSVTNIGKYAFYMCASLENISIPDVITDIGDYAFHGCASLTCAVIPDSVTSVGEYAFGGCASLASVTLPSGIANIESGAFSNCPLLESIVFQGTIEQWRRVEKANYWDLSTGDYTVRCTDGVVNKGE